MCHSKHSQPARLRLLVEIEDVAGNVPAMKWMRNTNTALLMPSSDFLFDQKE